MKKLLVLIIGLCSSLSIYAAEWPVPVSNKVTGVYGDYRGVSLGRPWGFHTGIDIEVFQGSAVYAVVGGIIDYVIDTDGDGIEDQLRIKNGEVYYCYAHLRNIIVKTGDAVVSGDKIAEVGSYWYEHLHFNLEDVFENPIANPLSILTVGDTVDPTVEGIYFRSEPDSEGNFYYMENLSPTITEAVIIWGKVDIIVKVTDIVGEEGQYRPGIYKIGYSISETPQGVDPVDTRWLVEFLGALPSADKLGVVYSEDEKCQSNQDGNFYYIVTNTDLNPDNCWDTKQKIDDSSTEAVLNSEARFPDGLYKVKIEAYDIAGHFDSTEKATKKVIIDNFRPYVKGVRVEGSEGVYEGIWEKETDTAMELKITRDETIRPGEAEIKIIFSESGEYFV